MSTANDKIPCVECGQPVSSVLAKQRDGLCFTCFRKHEETVPCQECGKPVSARLAKKRNGLCLPCQPNHNPFFVLYGSLICRVTGSPDGFQSLSEPEKTYYALTLLQNEVNNGGVHQFFFNGSGSYYDLIEKGLASFNEPQARELLGRAKEIVFADLPVPVDIEARRDQMRKCPPSNLNELDQRFYSTPDTLTPKLKALAQENGLVSAESESSQQ